MGGSSTVSSADSKPNDDLNKLESGATSTDDQSISISSDVTIERKAAGTDGVDSTSMSDNTDASYSKSKGDPSRIEAGTTSDRSGDLVLYRKSAGMVAPATTPVSAPGAVGVGMGLGGLPDICCCGCSVKICLIFWAVCLCFVSFSALAGLNGWSFWGDYIDIALGFLLFVLTMTAGVMLIVAACKENLKCMKIGCFMTIGAMVAFPVFSVIAYVMCIVGPSKFAGYASYVTGSASGTVIFYGILLLILVKRAKK